jgi:hypothetical protein
MRPRAKQDKLTTLKESLVDKRINKPRAIDMIVGSSIAMQNMTPDKTEMIDNT